jgi:hypothetical protein
MSMDCNNDFIREIKTIVTINFLVFYLRKATAYNKGFSPGHSA